LSKIVCVEFCPYMQNEEEWRQYDQSRTFATKGHASPKEVMSKAKKITWVKNMGSGRYRVDWSLAQ